MTERVTSQFGECDAGGPIWATMTSSDDCGPAFNLLLTAPSRSMIRDSNSLRDVRYSRDP